MLNTHRQSMLTNACVKPAVDPVSQTLGKIYEPRGQVRLLGLLSESSSSQQEDYLDAGDGMLICMKRRKRRGRNAAQKSCWESEQSGPNVSETSDAEPDQEPSRQQVVVKKPVPLTLVPSIAAVFPPSPEAPTQPRPGSFPFHWVWESFSIKGQGVYGDQFLEKPKKKWPPLARSISVQECPCTPAVSLDSLAAQGGGSVKEKQSPEGSHPPGAPEDPSPRHPKRMGPPAGSPLVPLYWKMEARSEARKYQLRRERRRWLQLTQKLLNLEAQSAGQEKHLSAKHLEEKLRAELLCLATEPPEPSPQREKGKAKSRAKEEPTFQPSINHKIPNFKSLQKRFQEQLEQKKVEQAKLTICKPFRLHTSASCSHPPTREEDKPEVEDSFDKIRQLFGAHWRAQSCPDFDSPLAPPVTPTKTSDKRQEANRYMLLLREWERREKLEKRQAEIRRHKEHQVQREVAKCLASYESTGRSVIAAQRRREELRRQEKLRMEEYMLQLQEMQDRVESRPYLFERVMQANARQAVERRFSQVLSALGIDEEMLWKHAAQKVAGKISSKARHRRTESSEDSPEST